jgi:hypothetical protein
MKSYKNKLKFLVFFVLSFLLISPTIFASTTDGTIDSTYKYAWGENVGYIDFGSTAGNVHITDTALSGYAYGENIGWINLSTVTNNSEGILSGYAWGENVGWIDFSKVTIDTDGIFSGSAYGENIGWITFGTTDNKVITDWRHESSRTVTPSSPSKPSSHSSSGSSASSQYTNLLAMGNTKAAEELKQQFPNQIVSVNTNTPVLATRTLKLTTPHMNNTDVKDLQTYLNTHNYNCGMADGIFGNLTKQAVIKFQLANQLKGDGIVGPMTREKLK